MLIGTGTNVSCPSLIDQPIHFEFSVTEALSRARISLRREIVAKERAARIQSDFLPHLCFELLALDSKKLD